MQLSAKCHSTLVHVIKFFSFFDIINENLLEFDKLNFLPNIIDNPIFNHFKFEYYLNNINKDYNINNDINIQEKYRISKD